MRSRHGRVLALALAVATAGCVSTPDDAGKTSSVEPSVATTSSPYEPAAGFPTAAFLDIQEHPVPEETAAEYQAILLDMAGKGGMAATVMSPEGTWSGATGNANPDRDMRVNDQFAIGSVTKPIVAAQVMQMVEAGELRLDDSVNDHLPAHLDFDTNHATIGHLLGMRSGIPDYWLELKESLSTHRQRVWKTADMLELVPPDRVPAGDAFEYSNTNYLLLELVIEQVGGRRVVDVLRDGVLKIEGIQRLIYQPEEVPTEPMAMPNGESTAALKKGGGYLPSLASATAGPTTGAMASDSTSLGRWWRAFCAGEIVSQASVTKMSTFHDGYGLGLFNPYGGAVGHTGEDVGYVAWAGCLPENGSVVVVLSNRVVEDIGAMAGPLIVAASTD